MKATGIVRRIDDLGRVVIPKEIRRTMRIREGDPLGYIRIRTSRLSDKERRLVWLRRREKKKEFFEKQLQGSATAF